MALFTDSPVVDSDLDELRGVVREFLAAKAPVTRTLELMETGAHDEAAWQQMCEQLGLPALAIPERFGGQGFGLAELAVALEELGRVNYMGPFFATAVLASTAIQLGEDAEACEVFLPAFASGERTGTVALFEPERGWATTAVETRAVQVDGGWRVTGEKAWVLDGATADVLVVSAVEGLFAVNRGPEVTATPAPVLDLTRPLAHVSFADAPAVRVAGADVVEDLMRIWLAATAVEQVGAAWACLDLTVAYARERIQFGRPIGSYQAVRHRCADMFVAAEMAGSAARAAIRAIIASDDDQDVTVGVAASYCNEAALGIAESAIQVHGGIAFTWEHAAHVFFKRAKASALLCGDPAELRRRIEPALVRRPS